MADRRFAKSRTNLRPRFDVSPEITRESELRSPRINAVFSFVRRSRISLGQLSQQQLLELVGQLLAQVQLVSSTLGRITPGAGLPAIESEITAESTVTIEELPGGEPVVPIKIRSILR